MSKHDLLLEIGTEEIPAASVIVGKDQLKERAEAMLKRHRLAFDDIQSYGAPRRLALMVVGLDERQAKAVHEVRGPAKKVAYTEDGRPTKAAEGFAKSQGVAVESLEVRAHEGGEYVFAIKEEEGRAAVDILPEALPDLILSLSFPKAMRWGYGEVRFVRPIRWILALFGCQVVRFTVDGVTSGDESMGHRLLANHPVRVEAPCDYFEVLYKNYVIVDGEKRAGTIKEEIERVVRATGGRAVVHRHTFDEVVELVEYPHAVLGSFSEEFVNLPREIPVTAMESHQRYFPVEDDTGRLLPNFVVIHNGNPEYADLIRKGHERVIRARLSDAKYFFEADTKRPLDDYVERLKGVVFQAKLGTVHEKIQRILTLSQEIAKQLDLTEEEGDYAVRAAYLCKADLVTEMVGEFPTLQGVVGREYALLSGEPQEVADAIFEHYLPRSTGDILPATATGQIVSIADKLDSIAGILAAGLIPTGSEDPYALRRQAHGIVAIVLENDIALSMDALIALALDLYSEQGVAFDVAETARLTEDFIRSRLRAYLLGRGLPLDAVESVVGRSIDDMVDIKMRAEAVAQALDTAEMEDILVAFTRCKNLSRPELGVEVDEALLQEEAEKGLYQSLVRADTELEDAGRDYRAGIDILATLRDPIDRFFDDVLVMAEDIAIRNNRIRLLNYGLDMFLRVADFSRISQVGS